MQAFLDFLRRRVKAYGLNQIEAQLVKAALEGKLKAERQERVDEVGF